MAKGLNALFNNGEISKDEIVREIKLRELRPNPYQPRKSFLT